ncbi:MAG: nuclear transport factor 2 family protein [Burkholderiales bacterium]|nr:nuclear transport factor 2 family protein [Burkholderiales bacterium]
MNANPKLQAVQAIYQAFGAGNIPAILDKLAPDVRWEAWADNFGQRGGAPTLVERRGPDQVMAFFQVVGGLQIHSFQVLDLMAGERQVAAEVTIDFTVPATGHRYADEELHLWTFDAQGRVSRFRHYLDTAKHLRAFGLPLPQ